MRHGVFAVRDTCVESLMVPMFFQNKAAAVRALADAVNKSGSDNLYYQHPEHFQLYEIGAFDDSTGLIESFVAPEFIVDCQSLVRS